MPLHVCVHDPSERDTTSYMLPAGSGMFESLFVSVLRSELFLVSTDTAAMSWADVSNVYPASWQIMMDTVMVARDFLQYRMGNDCPLSCNQVKTLVSSSDTDTRHVEIFWDEHYPMHDRNLLSTLDKFVHTRHTNPHTTLPPCPSLVYKPPLWPTTELPSRQAYEQFSALVRPFLSQFAPTIQDWFRRPFYILFTRAGELHPRDHLLLHASSKHRYIWWGLMNAAVTHTQSWVLAHIHAAQTAFVQAWNDYTSPVPTATDREFTLAIHKAAGC